MDDEVCESTALRSLDDFEWLAVANGFPDPTERQETAEPIFLNAVVARLRLGKPLLFLFHADDFWRRIERLSLIVSERYAPAFRWAGRNPIGTPCSTTHHLHPRSSALAPRGAICSSRARIFRPVPSLQFPPAYREPECPLGKVITSCLT